MKSIKLIPKTRTDQQLAFVAAFAETGHGTNSAISAGYSRKSARSIAVKLKQTLSVEIHAAIYTTLTSAVPAALRTLIRLSQDVTVNEQVQLSASKDLLDRAGYNATTRVEITSERKSDEELREELRTLMGDVIDVTPTSLFSPVVDDADTVDAAADQAAA